ncbi:MAG: hypothetical protein ACEPO2_15305 [Pelagibaca sp.]
MNFKLNVNENHPHAALPHLWQGNVAPPKLADPDDPNVLSRSPLNKDDIGKSSQTCRVALVTRLHRRAVKQEFWCASFEESQVMRNIAAHPDVINFKEQGTRVDFVDETGRATHTRVDIHVLMRSGDEVLVSVKYDAKARRPRYLDHVAHIARQTPKKIADRFVVASRYTFHPVFRANAMAINKARNGWDPEADDLVLMVSETLGERFSFQKLVDAAGIGARGHRAVMRLVGDGDLRKELLAPLDATTQLWRDAA